MTVKFADYVGQMVTAKYSIERNIEGEDVPVIREGEITILQDLDGDIILFDDGIGMYPFDDTFELL